jgi:hypothetical protein
MRKKSQSLVLSEITQSKVKNFQTQKKIFFEYLKENTATASMVADATGIPQKCETRYKRELQKAGLLYEVVRKRCLVTGFKAWYLTANPDMFPVSIQLQMF